MDKETIKFLTNKESISEEVANLIAKAKEATNASYAPYSNFYVGAAALLEDGTIVLGSNFENASYPLCLCAERVALASIHSQYPNAVVKIMAVTARNPKERLLEPIAPCGACRQVLLEYEQKQKSEIQIIMFGEDGKIAICGSAASLLPMAFDHSFLSK
jgi:cytidine deaminase